MNHIIALRSAADWLDRGEASDQVERLNRAVAASRVRAAAAHIARLERALDEIVADAQEADETCQAISERMGRLFNVRRQP